MTIPGPIDTAPPLGALLARLRRAQGWSQAQLAERLCAASGVPTLTRHEISRWERQQRTPAEFWLGWLARVLGAPRAELAGAARGELARRARGVGAERGPAGGELDRACARLLRLGHLWLADPTGPITDPDAVGLRLTPAADLAGLRRLDDVVGGLDLLPLLGERLTATGPPGPSPASRPRRRRLFGPLAEAAQLTGWITADAGDAVAALRAYQRAVLAASAAGDRCLAAHALGSASHLLAGHAHSGTALLLARTAYAGARRGASPRARALLLHRIALAAAVDGRPREAERALAGAQRAADRVGRRPDPAWLYWLDDDELAAMTGRCLAALGRPLRAAPLLAAAVSRGGPPRSRALYGAWLAGTYAALGESDEACRVAGAALLDAVRAGSARAAVLVDEVSRRLGSEADTRAAQRHAALVAAARRYLPPPAGTLPRPARIGTARRDAGRCGSASHGRTG
ncbi:Helix-turn-helix domain-containing protein [Micromonospora pattaloongensis]|uniref:Helix-turn-helix domain-containing protein n=1 Tax=Micromonospora pattaloongensis TaxID=405436 RepID=A0A1H3Q0V6_9ACTN|nr:helix-turn-helix transcriptional regulator [Micromonospora pattaloongensis]SDZ06966.1 Helix-turn-helix domain-containing protein [Micromonospora pattaloongensis]